MELHKKIEKALDSDFIGDIKFDESELNQMKIDCKCFYLHAQQSWSKTYQSKDIDELVVLIVNIAKTWNDDKESRFWVKLFGEIFDDASISPTKFYNEFEKSLKRHNKTLFLSKENKRMFREVFLLHAFSPDKSRDSFIRLLWNWYSDADVIDYDYQFEDSLYVKIARFLDNKFSGEANMDEDSSFEGKTYAIKSSFKYLFTQNQEQGLRLLNMIFSFFDDIYFKGRYDVDSYFAESCYEIVNRILDESDEQIKHCKKKAEHIVSDFKRIYAAYEIDDEGNAAIFIPEIRAIDESSDEYILELLKDDRVIFHKQDYIVGSELKRRIKRISIPLSELRDQAQHELHFRVKLYILRDDYIQEPIYDSKQSLYREFILFNSSREIRNQTCKPSTYYVVHPSDAAFEKMTTCVVHNINQFTSTIVAEENDYITGLAQQVFFNQQPKDSYIGIDGCEIKSISFRKDNINYPFYKNVKSLIITLNQTIKAERIIIKVDDGNRLLLSACSSKKGNAFVVDLREIRATENGVHTIYISDSAEQKLLHSVMYYVNNEIIFNITGNEYIFDKNSINFTIQSNDGETIDTVYSCIPKCGMERLLYSFDNGEFIIELPYIKWRIDDSSEWYFGKYGKDFWKDDNLIHNNCIIEIENYAQRNVKMLINDEEIPISSNGKYLLGDALAERIKNKENDIILCIDEEKFYLFKVYNNPVLSDIDINLEAKSINLSPYFIGDPNTQFSIVLENEENYYEIASSVFSTFDIDIVDGEYVVSAYIVDFFGELGKSPILKKEDCIIGNPDKFYFKHSRIVLKTSKRLEGGKIRFRKTFITNLNYLREETIGAVYSGVLISNKKRFFVEVYKKSDKSLKFYIVEGEKLLSSNYDIIKNEFTKEEINENNKNHIISCSSCYYDKEEI